MIFSEMTALLPKSIRSEKRHETLKLLYSYLLCTYGMIWLATIFHYILLCTFVNCVLLRALVRSTR